MRSSSTWSSWRLGGRCGAKKDSAIIKLRAHPRHPVALRRDARGAGAARSDDILAMGFQSVSFITAFAGHCSRLIVFKEMRGSALCVAGSLHGSARLFHTA